MGKALKIQYAKARNVSVTIDQAKDIINALHDAVDMAEAGNVAEIILVKSRFVAVAEGLNRYLVRVMPKKQAPPLKII